MASRAKSKSIVAWLHSLAARMVGSPPGEGGAATTTFDATVYWEQRYRSGGTSGSGSEGILAQYKADVINQFLRDKQIGSVIEFGCGDGNQLSLMNYRDYTGMDIVPAALELCRRKFQGQPNWRFRQYDPAGGLPRDLLQAELVVCLDVLYHIIDERAFVSTLEDILRCAGRYVILYTNIEALETSAPHIKWRDTRAYLMRFPDFQILEVLAQPYPTLSGANFVILARRDARA